VEGRDYGDITSSIINTMFIKLVLGIAAKRDLEILTLDVPMAFLGCPLHEEIFMRLPEGNWASLDPDGQCHPLVQLKKMLYSIKQANRGFADEIYDFTS
jgi:hypothetical protein